MSNGPSNIALMAAQLLPAAPEGADAPEWVHLTPVGRVETFDSRGPYYIDDAQAVIDRSFDLRGDLEIDVNHAQFTAAAEGRETPARGWITRMEVRADGIWGQVQWTDEGRQLVASRAYRRISPVFRLESKTSRRVHSILNASLVNRNNLRGLTALNQETEDMFQETVAQLLGLDPGAAEADITAAIQALQGSQDETAELQAQIDGIGVALGVETGGDVLAAAQAARQGNSSQIIVALQADLSEVSAQLKGLQDAARRTSAEAFIDQAIRDRRVGVRNQRDRFIAMHMSDAEGTEALVRGFQTLDASGAGIEPPAPKDGTTALNAAQTQTARLLGVSAEDYAKTLAAERSQEITA